MRIASLWLFLGGISSLGALDWGGSLDNTATSSLVNTPAEASSASLASNLRFWVVETPLPGLTAQLKTSVSNTATQSLGAGHPFTDVVAVALDSATVATEWLRIGRADFRDFSGAVLSTKLDGVQALIALPNFDLKLYAATSAALFKSGSTVIISEDDTKDRQTAEDWRKPSTLWASPRLFGGVESAVRQWLPDQNFRLSLLGQLDLRSGQPKDGEPANTEPASRAGAPVSTGYLGAGWDGRLVGALYGSAWVYGVAGTSLTASGPVATVQGTGKDKSQTQNRTWKANTLVGALGAANLTLLVPTWNFLLVNASLQMGSWDADGATPDQNAPEQPNSMTPSLYSGWVGASRTGSAMIFNPQPANMVVGQMTLSLKPLETLQVASTTSGFLRPAVAPISESGLRPLTDERYLGIESDVTLLWRPASDLGASLGLGVFAPNTLALNRGLEAKFQTSLSLSY